MQLDLVAQIGGSLISIMFPLVCIWYTHDFQQFYKLCLRKAQLDKLVCLMYVIIIQRWFTLYNSNVNLWFTLFSHICLHNPSYLFIYSRLLKYFVIFFVKKKNHIYSCWDFKNHISYLEWLHMNATLFAWIIVRD